MMNITEGASSVHPMGYPRATHWTNPAAYVTPNQTD